MNLHKLQISSAVSQNGGRSNVNLNRHCLASAKIGQILPIMHQECVPGDKFRFNIHNFSRFMPLAVPAYVDLTYRTMSVFVPYHQVADGCESFFSNQAKFKGQNNTIPMLTRAVIEDMFIYYANTTGGDLTTRDSSAVTNDPMRYKQYTGGTLSYTYKLTAKGAYFEKVLHLLGYRWARQNSQAGNFSALPLLAFAHAYNSFLSYSANYNTSELSNILETIKRSPNISITRLQLYNILSSILLTYEESFFSTLWQRAFSPVGDNTVYKSTQLDDDEISGLVGNTVDFSYNAGGMVAVEDTLTSNQVRLMLKFDKMFRRQNFAGSKDVEQIYSKFGLKIDDYKTRYPYFLGETFQRVQIGDVTSTSDTAQESGGSVTGSVLGSYAGKAIQSDNAGFSFDSHDYGMLFTFAWYAPRPMYWQGVDKECLRLGPFDFYNPDLDEGFATPVSRAQLDGQVAGTGQSATIGYGLLYSEYLYANDQIVGDFERFTGMEAWHFGRQNVASLTAQTDTLIYMSASGTEFERIFNIADPTLVDADTIYLTVDVQCSAIRPMKDFVGKSGLGSGDIDLPMMGSQIN